MRIAEEYVDTRLQRLKNEDLNRKPNKWLTRLPQFGSARRVLDIACGLGYDSFAWARAGKGVVGFDFNPDLVKNARQLGKSLGFDIDFLVADATILPFADNFFDICYSENLFEHVPEWEKIVAEVHRVLAPGGLFFVRTSNRHCPINHEINHLHFYPWLPQWMKRPILNWVMEHRPAWVNYSRFPAVNWFTHPGMVRYLRKAGFDSFEVFDLFEPDAVSSSSRKLAFVLPFLRQYRLLRYVVYFTMRSVQVFATKPKLPATAAVPSR